MKTCNASAMGLLLAGLLASIAAAADEPTNAAVWHKQEYSFAFMGFTTTYSCDGLAAKLKVLLIAAGARADAKAQPGPCASGFGRVDKFASSDLTFYTLVPTDAASPADAAGPKIGGAWRSVAVSRGAPRQLELGDCELVEQFASVVLPKFTTRNIVDQTSCVPHQLSGSIINLKFDSFAALPSKPQSAAQNSSNTAGAK
jgi:hypothetical protein